MRQLKKSLFSSQIQSKAPSLFPQKSNIGLSQQNPIRFPETNLFKGHFNPSLRHSNQVRPTPSSFTLFKTTFNPSPPSLRFDKPLVSTTKPLPINRVTPSLLPITPFPEESLATKSLAERIRSLAQRGKFKLNQNAPEAQKVTPTTAPFQDPVLTDFLRLKPKQSTRGSLTIGPEVINSPHTNLMSSFLQANSNLHMSAVTKFPPKAVNLKPESVKSETIQQPTELQRNALEINTLLKDKRKLSIPKTKVFT